MTIPLVCVQVIEKFLQSTHACTHSDYTMSVLDIFKLDREGESDGFQQLHNRYCSRHTPLHFVLCCCMLQLCATVCDVHQDSAVARLPSFQLGGDPQPGAANRSPRSSRHWLHGRADASA